MARGTGTCRGNQEEKNMHDHLDPMIPLKKMAEKRQKSKMIMITLPDGMITLAAAVVSCEL